MCMRLATLTWCWLVVLWTEAERTLEGFDRPCRHRAALWQFPARQMPPVDNLSAERSRDARQPGIGPSWQPPLQNRPYHRQTSHLPYLERGGKQTTETLRHPVSRGCFQQPVFCGLGARLHTACPATSLFPCILCDHESTPTPARGICKKARGSWMHQLPSRGVLSHRPATTASRPRKGPGAKGHIAAEEAKKARYEPPAS